MEKVINAFSSEQQFARFTHDFYRQHAGRMGRCTADRCDGEPWLASALRTVADRCDGGEPCSVSSRTVSSRTVSVADRCNGGEQHYPFRRGPFRRRPFQLRTVVTAASRVLFRRGPFRRGPFQLRTVVTAASHVLFRRMYDNLSIRTKTCAAEAVKTILSRISPNNK
jgi:hypothetical protein